MTAAEDPWIWLEGLHPLGFWMPLYCFPKKDGASKPRSILRRIMRTDPLPRELVEYDDFRINEGDLEREEFDPEPDVVARYAELARQRAPQASVKRSGTSLDAPQRKAPIKPVESPTEPRAKKILCRECMNENPKRRCIRREDHAGKHKDAKGRRW